HSKRPAKSLSGSDVLPLCRASECLLGLRHLQGLQQTPLGICQHCALHPSLGPKLDMRRPDPAQFFPNDARLHVKIRLCDAILDKGLEEVGVHAERDVRQHPPWRPVVNGATSIATGSCALTCTPRSTSIRMIPMAGDSRTSSVPGLNASPSTPMVRPRKTFSAS